MPYLLISTQIRLEIGPTFVGDSESDQALMERLQAKPSRQLGNEFVVSFNEVSMNSSVISFFYDDIPLVRY